MIQYHTHRGETFILKSVNFLSIYLCYLSIIAQLNNINTRPILPEESELPLTMESVTKLQITNKQSGNIKTASILSPNTKKGA